VKLKLGLGLLCAGLALPMNPQSPQAWCEDTCLVLDMDYVGTYGCDCVCKDVDGTVHSEPVPDCP
jgi:hypothetical protein